MVIGLGKALLRLMVEGVRSLYTRETSRLYPLWSGNDYLVRPLLMVIRLITHSLEWLPLEQGVPGRH